MQCACGYLAPFSKKNSKGTLSDNRNIKAFNLHRRNCDVFWLSVKNEIERIAIDIYGKISPVTRSEWDRNRIDGMPSHEVFASWGYTWPRVQQKTGQPMSVRGKGAIAWVRAPLTETERNLALDAIALTIHPVSVSAESYMAQTSREGLLICEQSYLKTGRMWLR